MIRPPSALAAAALGLALQACIENPGPDPRLLLPRPEVREEWAGPIHGYFSLRFRLERDSTGTALSVLNIGKRVDSVEFLLEARDPSELPSGGIAPGTSASGFDATAFVLHARIPVVRPCVRLELGLLDSLPPGPLRDLDLDAIDFQARTSLGPTSPCGGRYAGTWTAREGGTFRSGFRLTRPDGSPVPERDSTGALRLEDGRLHGRFGFTAPRRLLDSLYLDLAAILPRALAPLP